jgi:HlyD family secretion protein
MNSTQESLSDISKVLGLDRPSVGRKSVRFAVAGVVALGVTAAIITFLNSGKGTTVRFKITEAKRGDLAVIVTATGTLEPVNQVDVGIEVSGTIRTVEVDYNDRVKVGQILARLDTQKLEAQVLQSQATLESIQSKLVEAEATRVEARDNLERFKRVRDMSGGKVPSEREYDAAEASLKRALANEATLKAQVSEAKAKLSIDQTNLAKAVIHSPVNGVVLKRSVEPGQTVAASLQAPVLFTLAEDLTQMELQVDVDEADVGQVQQGQRATFTVDAYPDRAFPARITQVRYGSQNVAGVVTYKAVLKVDNASLSLRPGMTATAAITVKKVDNAILVPNAALRFTPPAPEPDASTGGGGLVSKILPRPPGSVSFREEAKAGIKQQRLWTVRNGQLEPIPITTGATDGVMTEVTGGGIEPGMTFVVDIVNASR